jgi:secreted Zn-dependent insulinase-like peptidase
MALTAVVEAGAVQRMDQLADFCAVLLARCRVEALVCGNVGLAQAQAMQRSLRARLAEVRSRPLAEAAIPRLGVLSVPATRSSRRDAGDPWRAVNGLVHPLEARQSEGHSVDLYFQLGPDSLHNRLLAETIEALMSEPLYADLRTRQQVGYVVRCQTVSVLGTLGFVIDVMSNTLPPQRLALTVDTFLESFRDQLAAMDARAFHRAVSALARTKVDAATGRGGVAPEQLWEVIALQRYVGPSPHLEWRSSTEEITALRQWMTQRRLLAAYDRWLLPSSNERRRVSVLVFGTSFQGDAVRELTKRSKTITMVDSQLLYKREPPLPAAGATAADLVDAVRGAVCQGGSAALANTALVFQEHQQQQQQQQQQQPACLVM